MCEVEKDSEECEAEQGEGGDKTQMVPDCSCQVSKTYVFPFPILVLKTSCLKTKAKFAKKFSRKFAIKT